MLLNTPFLRSYVLLNGNMHRNRLQSTKCVGSIRNNIINSDKIIKAFRFTNKNIAIDKIVDDVERVSRYNESKVRIFYV